MVGCLLLTVVVMSGCINCEETEEETITITDHRGKEVEIPKNVERIVAITVPAISLICAIDGSGERIVGMNPVAMKAIRDGVLGEMYPYLKTVPTNFVKGMFEPNVEEVLKLEPDVVFQLASRGENVIKPLEDAGIPTIGLLDGTQEYLETWMTIFGKVLGKEDKAAELIEYHHTVLHEIKEKTSQIAENEKPKVLYLPWGPRGLKTAGSKVYPQWYTDLTGGINVAKELKGYQTVSMEQIIVWDPDIIYVGNFGPCNPQEILDNEIEGQDWIFISAVKNNRVYKVPLGGFRWTPPNQESPLMWKWLAEIQHPDLFDYDLRQDMKDFYSEFYGYDLSEEQVDEILHCDMNKDLSCCD